LGNQYSGRHISYWKLNIVDTEMFALDHTGKIQVGAEPGASAQVSVPACGVPLAGGTEPNAPDTLETDPLEPALLQAARPRATAQAASIMARRGMLTGFPRDQVAPYRPGYLAPALVPALCAVESSATALPS